MDDEPRRMFGGIPDEAIAQRATLWPMVNWIFGIRLSPLASRRRRLVVGAGDELHIPGNRKVRVVSVVPLEKVGEFVDGGDFGLLEVEPA